MVYEYKWREGYTPKVDATTVGKIFEKLEEKDGAVNRFNFLEYSRSKKSPTHCLFEWDDKIAGEKYRLDTARRIINQIQIVTVDAETENKTIVPAYVNVDSERNASYINIVDALKNEESKDLIISRIKRDIDGLVQKYQGIEEFADIVLQAVEDLKKGA